MAIEAQSFYAGSIDVQVSKPLDAREYVKAKEDLINQVKELKSQGLKQKEVAEKLNKSLRTIKGYWNK